MLALRGVMVSGTESTVSVLSLISYIVEKIVAKKKVKNAAVLRSAVTSVARLRMKPLEKDMSVRYVQLI